MMKKLLTLFLLLTLLLGCCSALADGIPADIEDYFEGRVEGIMGYVRPGNGDVAYVTTTTDAVYCFRLENGRWACQWASAMAADAGFTQMPEDVRAYIAREAWAEKYVAVSFVRPAQGDTSFVSAMGMDGVNRLFCFRLEDGAWSYQWSRKAPMPQDGEFVSLADASGSTVNGLPLGTAFILRQNTPTGRDCIYELDGKVWKLRMITGRDTDGTVLETYLVENGVVKYEGWRKTGQQRIYGTLQTDLRYFSFRDFPYDPDELRSILSNPPSIPEGTLSAQRIQFTGGQKYPVYNGPGMAYGQSGEGNAHVSTNDWIQVFGEEDGWIMIQYDITRDHMRIGWIDADALPANASVKALTFTPIPAYMTSGAYATDDPLGSQESAFYLREGVSVQWLATMGDWAYVESTDGSLMRGFVPLSRISADDEWEK